MSRILLIFHEGDREQGSREPGAGYLVSRLIPLWARAKHHIYVAFGPGNLPEADLAFMHVDLSVRPEAYEEMLGRYPLVVNGAVRDVRKRTISRLLVGPGDDWDGPVIAKSDLNFAGIPEALQRQAVAASGSGPRRREEPDALPYAIFESLRAVPEEGFADPRYVIERFLSEREGERYCVRTWTFLGDRERCTRYMSPEPIVKAGNVVAREPAEVPDDLRAERERLGFDYGKFDFVLNEGMALLFDANPTPGVPPRMPEIEAGNAALARGIDLFVERAAALAR